MEYNIENWISREDISKLKYFEYWNDKNEETSKEWNILDGNFEKMENYLKKVGLTSDLKNCIALLKNKYNLRLKGIGLDLAAGNLWSVPQLLSSELVDKMYCLEYSKHRLTEIGPVVLEHYNIPKDKVVLVYGSFYELKLSDNSVDFILLAQAFHHADKPKDLLTEIDRVLKPGGVVIIIGEHTVAVLKAYFKNTVKYFLCKCMPAGMQEKIFGKTFHAKKLLVKPSDLFPPNPRLGDHYYTLRQYNEMFSSFSFRVEHIKGTRESHFQSFVLVKAK